MLRWLLLLPVLLGFLSQEATAQIYINPGDGVSVAPGGYIYVDNWTDEPALVEVRLADGTLLAAVELPPHGWGQYQIPKSPALLGSSVTTKASNSKSSASSTNPIGTGSDGAARPCDADRDPLRRGDVRDVRDVSPPRR